MIKSLLNSFMIYSPMLINMILILLLINPSKNNKLPPMLFMYILIFLTMLITFKMNFMFYSWISFMLFLIMIGGLMIIFMYITSLSNNEFFLMNINNIYINLMKMLPIIIMYLLINLINNEYNLINLNNIDSWIMNINYNQPLYNSLYKENNNKSSYFMMLYLYYSMICIMNICYKLKAPLRQMMF